MSLSHKQSVPVQLFMGEKPERTSKDYKGYWIV